LVKPEITLRDIIRARTRRRRDLRHTLQERARMVDMLLEARRGESHIDEPLQTYDTAITAEKPPECTGSSRLKRYMHE
jgi:hypothetical protein